MNFEGLVSLYDGARKLSVPGRPNNLSDSRARAYCACSRCGRDLFGYFFSHLSFLIFFLSFSGRSLDID